MKRVIFHIPTHTQLDTPTTSCLGVSSSRKRVNEDWDRVMEQRQGGRHCCCCCTRCTILQINTNNFDFPTVSYWEPARQAANKLHTHTHTFTWKCTPTHTERHIHSHVCVCEACDVQQKKHSN